ncbi:MAG: outer membrane beta-barrel protein [Flavobacteriaceae bacterium]|nr:outer membrane beta-barrel protein [Flavobacteriaceae bacterium]
MKFIYKIFLLVLFIPLSNSYAQLDLSHEIGVSFGPVTMQTDYGERNHLPSSTATSFGIAFAHYLSFYGSNYNWRNGASYFSDHFKLKTEVSYYFNNNLEHKGRFAEQTDSFGDQIRAMKGSTKIFNVGTQLEYYFKNLEDYGLLFNDSNKFAPYISVGFHYNSFDPEVSSDLGNYITNPEVLPLPWQENAIFVEKDNTFSFTFSAGTRYKLDSFDLFIDARWQYFLSDRVDGLDAPSEFSGSKFNDTLIYFSVGAIFDLSNFYSGR